jgi:hypothetical protein
MATRGFATLDPAQGSWAVSHARSVVDAVVESGSLPPVPSTVDPVFEADRGAFVTLEKATELRGCIGRPEPEQPAIRAIREAAQGAVTEDPRFPPVGPSELEAITVEVSVLTAPRPIEASEPQAIMEAITVGEHGLILRGRDRSGLLLPQVPVEQGWGVETFLDHTSQKAGLSPGAWRDPTVSVERFSAQVFAEVEPYGPVEEASRPGSEQ